MKTIFISQKDNRSWSTSPEAFEGMTYPASVPDDFTGGAMTHNRITDTWESDPVYVRTIEDDIYDSTNYRKQLLAEADKTIYPLVIDLNLGIISDDDKAVLLAWRMYIKELDAMELVASPEDTTWPEKPSM